MFQFPFGTLHQLNLDWFLQQWEIYKQEWADAQAGIDNALQGEIDRVEDSMQDLYDARDAAVQAKEDAEDAADSVIADAAQAGADALKSEGFAVGEQDGTPVGAGSPYYQQNAKYYKVEAGTYRYLSEAYAKGEMGGSPVAPGEAGYQDNAKYYKNAADADAVQTAADRVQTGLDRTATGNDALATAADRLVVAQDKLDVDTMKDNANQAALRAEGWADGKQNGTPVASGSPYYENNAEYYKDLAASVVMGADGAAAQAMIAVEEVSTTLTADYPAGSRIRVQGVLYKTTTDLSTGDTLSVGDNCVIDVIGNDLSVVEQSLDDITTVAQNVLIKNSVTGNPIVINDGFPGMPFDKLIVEVEPVQSGSGTPAPNNPREFVQMTGININISDADTSNPSILPVSWNSELGTVRSGLTIDVKNGIANRKNTYVKLAASWTWYRQQIGGNYYFCTRYLYSPLQTYKNLIGCTHFKFGGNGSAIGSPGDLSIRNAYERYYPLNIRYDAITSVSAFESFLSNNDVYMVYQSSGAGTDTPIQPLNGATNYGENHIWTDNPGDISLEYVADTKLYIDNKIAEIQALILDNI